MTLDDKLTAIRNVIQHDIGNRGLARDPEKNLINAFPADFANACKSIGYHPSPSVAIVTGFYIANADPPCGETDGPLGAIYLARAFHSLGIPAYIETDSFCCKAVQEGLNACGLGRRDPVDSSSGVIPVLTIPPAKHPWHVFLKLDWSGIIQFRAVTHLISIERVGPARDDRCYSMRGVDISAFMSPAHLLFEDAARRHPPITTIGIGDGGNEIGMGKIAPAVIERNIANGAQIACRSATDHLIVAGISNWGGYALSAGVALVRGTTLDESLFDPEVEQQILEAMVLRGPLVDGRTAQQTVTVDGVAFDDYIAPLTSIRRILMAQGTRDCGAHQP